MDYKESGVDIESGDDVVRRIKSIARATFTPGVLSEIGAFGGMFRFPSSNYSDPILISSADGVTLRGPRTAHLGIDGIRR